MTTMYGSRVAEFLTFLVDFFVFSTKAIYFMLEALILTIIPDRYRKLKVSLHDWTHQTIVLVLKTVMSVSKKKWDKPNKVSDYVINFNVLINSPNTT